ncbi:MAG: hypothetical protein E7342_01880 [Clostridiales bacterium]|nr:hypothetical protein [Clostridiales bacterium]
MLKRKSVISDIYIFIILLLPMFAQYAIGPIDFDVILLLFVVFLLFVTKRLNITVDGPILLLLTYTLLVTLCNLLVGKLYATIFEIVFRLGKYILYFIVSILIGVNRQFKYDRAMQIYRIIAFFAVAYILLQALFYYLFNITLPNKIGKTIVEQGGVEVGRLRSFYSEPAEFAYSMIPFIVCSLFGKNYKKKDTRFFDAIFVSIGIVISTSGQGIVCCAAMWVIWIIEKIIKRELNVKTLATIILIVIVACVLYTSGILSFALDRVNDTGEYSAMAARFSGYKTLSLLNILQLVFGVGYGNYVTKNIYGLDVPYEFVNYSSIAENLFTIGIIGFCLLVFVFFKAYKKGNKRSKALIFAILILSTFGCPLISKLLPIYLSFVYVKDGVNNSKKVIEENKDGEGK